MTVALKREIGTLLKSGEAARARDLCLSAGAASLDPELLALQASAHLQLGEVDAAIEVAQRAIGAGLLDVKSIVMLIALLTHKNRVADASRYEKILGKAGIAAHLVQREVAIQLVQLGSLDQAISCYRRSILPGEQDPAVYSSLSRLLHQAGRIDEAIKSAERAVELAPDSSAARCQLGQVLAVTKQFDRAVAELQRSVALDGTNTLAMFHLGENLQQQNRFAEAIVSYRNAIAILPGEPALHGSMGRALRNLGDIQGALACQRHVLELSPHSSPAYHETGICLYMDSNTAPAREAFAKAVQYDPGAALSHFYLGMIDAQSGNAAAAQSGFAEACRIWPYLDCFVDSFRHALEHGAGARYVATARQLFEVGAGSAAPDGLFLEFGVYNGASINVIAGLTSQTVHGFDTFQGLPDDWVIVDGDRRNIEKAGSYSTHGRLPVAPENVRFHVGTFDETLPGFCAEFAGPVSFMNVDCDMYSSTRSIFAHLGGQIRPGTVIAFDDYFCLPGWRDHEYRAFREFLDEYGYRYEYLAFNLFAGQAVVRIT